MNVGILVAFMSICQLQKEMFGGGGGGGGGAVTYLMLGTFIASDIKGYTRNIHSKEAQETNFV